MTSTVLEYRADSPDTRARYRVLALLCLAASVAYVQRAGVAVSASAIRSSFHLDTFWFGTVLAAFGLGYALMQIPSGWLADRWGSRVALALYASLWSTLTGATALAQGYGSLLALWCLMGAAQAGIFPASIRAIRNFFGVEQRGMANGFLASSMAIGGALAPAVTGLLIGAMSWRLILLAYALPGIAWAVLWYSSVREPRGAASNNAANVNPEPAAHVFDRIVTSPSMWLLCAQQFLRAAAMIFFATWFPTFLQESRHVSVAESGYLTAFAGGGAILGSLLGGVVSDRVLVLTGSHRLSRQGLAVCGMVACATLIFTAHFVAHTTLAVGVISAGTFCGTFGGVSGYTVAVDFGGRRSATVFSVMNMCGNFGAMLFPLAIGWLVRRTGNWDLALFIFAGIFAVDAVCWALLNPKGPLFPEGVESTMNHAVYDAHAQRDNGSDAPRLVPAADTTTSTPTADTAAGSEARR
jgi:sugar phosphate permease